MRDYKAIEIFTSEEARCRNRPVADDTGRFKGMISRDSLLRTGFGKSETPSP